MVSRTVTLRPSQYKLVNSRSSIVGYGYEIDQAHPAENMVDADATTFCRVNTVKSADIHLYLHDFDLSLVPSTAVIESISFTVYWTNWVGGGKLRVYASNAANGRNVSATLVDGEIWGSTSATTGSSTPTPHYTSFSARNAPAAWEVASGLGSNFAILAQLYGSNSTTHPNDIYDAYVSVTYQVPVNKVTVSRNGTPETLIDLTADTVTPEKLLSGYTAHDRSGAIITGTFNPTPSLQSKSATPTESAQTITADSGYDGLSQVTVNPIPTNYGLITYNGSSLMVS